MKKIILKTLTFCAALFFMSQAYAAQSTQSALEKNDALKKTLTNLIQAYNIPGAVLSYAYGDQPIQTIAVGVNDINPNSSLTENTLFLTGSVTKLFVAAAILQQVEAGKLSIDETLSQLAKQYGGELATSVKQYPTLGIVTVRQLLNHTSGVPEDFNTKAFAAAFVKDPMRTWSDQELLAIAMQKPFFFKPGTPELCSYTNTDYLLLGIVLKSITHKPISTLFEQLWTEAKLKDIYYADNGVLAQSVINKMAYGYLDTNDDNPLTAAFKNAPVVNIPGAKHKQAYKLHDAYTIFPGSSGGIVTNTQALTQWYQALFQGNLLTSKSINTMIHNGAPIGKKGVAEYGLGVLTFHSPQFDVFVSHDGLTPGYSVICFYFFKYHLAMTLAINSSDPAFSDTIDYDTGKFLPGAFAELMPILIEGK
jgi:D-alanyl-D-alanine carboxypeptidase